MIHDSSIHSQQKNRKTLKFQCSFLGFTFWGPLSRALCSNSLSEGLIIGFSSSKLSMSSTSSKCKAIWRFQGGQCMVSPQQTMTKHCYFMLFPYPIGPMYTISTKIYHTNQPNAGKYTIHGSYGYCSLDTKMPAFTRLPTATGHRWWDVVSTGPNMSGEVGLLKLIPKKSWRNKMPKKKQGYQFLSGHTRSDGLSWIQRNRPILSRSCYPSHQSCSRFLWHFFTPLSVGQYIICGSLGLLRRKSVWRFTIVSPIPVPITRQLSCHRR